MFALPVYYLSEGFKARMESLTQTSRASLDVPIGRVTNSIDSIISTRAGTRAVLF